jgi:hypothetical protein
VPVFSGKKLCKFMHLSWGLKRRPENSPKNRQFEYLMCNFYEALKAAKTAVLAMARLSEKP